MSAKGGKPPRILHIHATFDEGAKELRSVRLINAFARDADHAIVSADKDRRNAAHQIARGLRISWPRFPQLHGRPTPGRLNAIGAAMAGYDLICTYGWGAMNAVLAHTLLADLHKLPPLVHHEDGFDDDEATRLKTTRNWYRRIALGRTSALVVPSKRIERIALETWQQPRSRVRLIPPGIATRAITGSPKRDILPRLIKRRDEFWMGTFADLEEGANLDLLVRTIAKLPEEWQLVIVGEGPGRDALMRLAEEMGTEDRVHLPGSVAQPDRLVGLFDIYAQPAPAAAEFPVRMVEAMAAALPVLAPRMGETADMLASDNGPYLAEAGDEASFIDAARQLAHDPQARKRVGQANRTRAREEYDEKRMIERYRALYWGLMNRPRIATEAPQ